MMFAEALMKKQPKLETDDNEIARRADEGIRRALNTPPKQHAQIKKERKKRQGERPTASDSEKQT
jgi:hypothetical protein